MKNIIQDFYTSFQQLDAEGMINCYHDEVVFEDPVFGVLEGEHANNMWRMLCSNAKDLKIEFSDIIIQGHDASAHWEAYYTFGKTGNKVHNSINAIFEIRNNRIIKHTDSFNLYKWSKQAMGFKGLILGHTNYFKSKIQTKAQKSLLKFVSKITK